MLAWYWDLRTFLSGTFTGWGGHHVEPYWSSRSASLVRHAVSLIAAAAVAGTSACTDSGNPTGASAPPTVIALTMNGVATMSVGETVPFVPTARMSDGRIQNVATTATWETSAVVVARVEGAGSVTAVGAGVVDITASYGGQRTSASVRVLGTAPAKVRFLYVVPQDRTPRADYAAAIEMAMLNLQGWYRDQLGGKTFALATSQPATCRLPRSADYYAIDSWSKVLADVQGCAPVSAGSGDVAWVLYVDVVHACNAPGRLGAGTTGLAMMPRQDMDGLIGARYISDCGEEYRFPISRYIGGAGHELGHALGLPHPPGCNEGLESCDRSALMWAGYASYPTTYLRDDEKLLLRQSAFIR